MTDDNGNSNSNSNNELAIKIDKHVPEPTRVGGGVKKYPWKEMEVGDSFFVPNAPINRMSANACMAVQTQSGLFGRKYSCHTVKPTDGQPGGVRVFRIV